MADAGFDSVQVNDETPTDATPMAGFEPKLATATRDRAAEIARLSAKLVEEERAQAAFAALQAERAAQREREQAEATTRLIAEVDALDQALASAANDTEMSEPPTYNTRRSARGWLAGDSSALLRGVADPQLAYRADLHFRAERLILDLATGTLKADADLAARIDALEATAWTLTWQRALVVAGQTRPKARAKKSI